MTTIDKRGRRDVPVSTTPETESRQRYAGYVWAITRIALGWIFLWAFLDKTFGWGFATESENAWINGGSPTTGYLSNVDGTFAGFFNDLAGQAWADWLFMIGLLGIGLAFVLGVGIRIGAIAGTIMLVLMWMASLPLENNPFMDDHLIYALVLIGLALINAGDVIGLGKQWAKTDLVRKYPILR